MRISCIYEHLMSLWWCSFEAKYRICLWFLLLLIMQLCWMEKDLSTAAVEVGYHISLLKTSERIGEVLHDSIYCGIWMLLLSGKSFTKASNHDLPRISKVGSIVLRICVLTLLRINADYKRLIGLDPVWLAVVLDWRVMKHVTPDRSRRGSSAPTTPWCTWEPTRCGSH